MVIDMNDVAMVETMLDFHEYFPNDYMFCWLWYELWADYKYKESFCVSN